MADLCGATVAGQVVASMMSRRRRAVCGELTPGWGDRWTTPMSRSSSSSTGWARWSSPPPTRSWSPCGAVLSGKANGVMAMIHAALYARVSSARQKQHETIDSQVACLRGYARMRGWEVPGDWVFTDDGWPGSTLARPALERLRDLSAQQLVERVLCLAPDRLARNYAHQVLLAGEFTKNGTELMFIRNPEADTPEQALMVQVQGVIAEYERAQTAERTRRGKLHRARSGQVSVLGRAPYGYRSLSTAEHEAAAY